jgi:hypothetical protein
VAVLYAPPVPLGQPSLVLEHRILLGKKQTRNQRPPKIGLINLTASSIQHHSESESRWQIVEIKLLPENSTPTGL